MYPYILLVGSVKEFYNGSQSVFTYTFSLSYINPASTTYETNKGPKWVLIWGLCGRPIWAPVSFCKRFSDGTNMVYQ